MKVLKTTLAEINRTFYYCPDLTGQLISKGLFGVFNSSKKRTKTRCIIVLLNFFVHFLEEFRIPTSPIEVN